MQRLQAVELQVDLCRLHAGLVPSGGGIASTRRAFGVECQFRLEAPVQRQACLHGAILEIEREQGGWPGLQLFFQCRKGLLQAECGVAAGSRKRMRSGKSQGFGALQPQPAICVQDVVTELQPGLYGWGRPVAETQGVGSQQHFTLHPRRVRGLHIQAGGPDCQRLTGFRLDFQGLAAGLSAQHQVLPPVPVWFGRCFGLDRPQGLGGDKRRFSRPGQAAGSGLHVQRAPQSAGAGPMQRCIARCTQIAGLERRLLPLFPLTGYAQLHIGLGPVAQAGACPQSQALHRAVPLAPPR